MKPEITIASISYDNKKDVRILKACLETWFQNPKDLNLTSPSMRYPFSFTQWIAHSYNNKNTVSYVIKKDNWIIGHMSLQLNSLTNSVHLFHVFIDRDNRGKGYSKLLIGKAIAFAKDSNYGAITLYVLPKNEPALKLYRSYGFSETGDFSQTGSPRLKLKI